MRFVETPRIVAASAGVSVHIGCEPMAPEEQPLPAGGPAPPAPGSLTQRRHGDFVPGDPGTALPVLDLAVLEEEARDRLPPAVADYYAGGAERETTLQEAQPACRAWRLRPRVLRGGSAVSVATSLLGADVATPVGVAPWAYQALAHPDGECGTAR